MSLSKLLSSVFKHTGGSIIKGAGQINSFSKITIRETGFRAFEEEFELLHDEETTSLTLYSGAWHFNDNVAKEDCTVFQVIGGEEFYNQVLSLLNEYHVGSWNGFHGNNPPGVRDGTMFEMHGVINGDVRLYATGSNNFPKGYHNFLTALKELGKKAGSDQQESKR